MMSNISISQPFKPRLGELDFLKGIAILGVIIVHVVQHGLHYSYGNSTIEIILDALSRFCVPFFVFVSGAAFSFNYQDKENYFWSFILKRLRYIGIPYLLWSAVGFIRYRIYEIKSIIIGLITGMAIFHLYFIILIFQFYVLAPLMLRLCKISGWKVLVISFLANMVLLIFYTNPILLAYFKLNYLYSASINPLFWLSYFFAGLVIGMNVNSFREYVGRTKLVYLIIVWLITAIVSVYHEYTSFAKTGSFLTFLRPTNMIYTFTSILLYWALFDKINSRVKSLLTTLGKYSFGIYLVHIPVLYSIHTLTKSYWGNPLMQVFSFIVCIIVSFAFTFIVSKIKFGVYVVGKAG